METRKQAPKPMSYAIKLIGTDKNNNITAYYEGTETPNYMTLLKFASCHSLLIEDADHKVIKVK